MKLFRDYANTFVNSVNLLNFVANSVRSRRDNSLEIKLTVLPFYLVAQTHRANVMETKDV